MLASESPRRRVLLAQAGIVPDAIRPAQVAVAVDRVADALRDAVTEHREPGPRMAVQQPLGFAGAQANERTASRDRSILAA